MSTITEYPSVVPQKGQDPQDFDNNSDALFLWWTNSPAEFNGLRSEVLQALIGAISAKNSAESASQSVVISLQASAQVLADLTVINTTATAREVSLEADIVTAQSVQADIASDIASANLPSGIMYADAGKKMQVKADGSGWEVCEHAKLLNGSIVKMGGTYLVKSSATFVDPIIVADMSLNGSIKLRNHPDGDLKTYPVTIKLPMFNTMNGESVIIWKEPTSGSLELYKISASEWSYEMTVKASEKIGV